MKNDIQKMIPTRSYHASPRLTHELKQQLERKVKRLFVNKEFIAFIKVTIEKLPQKDKLACLHFFKKVAIQVPRLPDPDHFKAFEDTYIEEMLKTADEQEFYEPVKWINAEIEYLQNTGEHLTTEDVNNRVDIMLEAKQKLSKDWLTEEQTMELFSISKSTLNRRMSEGMPHHKNGKFVYFYLDEINQWMKKDVAA